MTNIFEAGPAGFKGPEHLGAGPIGFSPGPLPLYAEPTGFILPWFYLGMLVGAVLAQATPEPGTKANG